MASNVIDDCILTHYPDDYAEHVIMAVDIDSKGSLGCAYYVASEESLYCMEDTATVEPEVLDALKLEIQPTVLVMSTRFQSASSNLQIWSSDAQGSFGLDGQQVLSYTTVVRPLADFQHETALEKLSAHASANEIFHSRFYVPGHDWDRDETAAADGLGYIKNLGQLLQISGSINLENVLGVGCIGAVITHIRRIEYSEYLQTDPNSDPAYRISSMQMFTLKDTMLISTDTFLSLQIFLPELHPNATKQGPGAHISKESFSVFGLFSRFAKSSQGKAKLRRLFLRPTLDVDNIEGRLDFVATIFRPENQAAGKDMSKSLAGIKNMRSTMTILQKGTEGGITSLKKINSGVWNSLIEFCFHAIDIADALKELVVAHRSPIIARAGEILNKFQLRRIGKTILDIVDLDQSDEQRRTCIRRGVDPDLDHVRDLYDGIEDLLGKVAQDVTSCMPLHIGTSVNVVFLPQLGFYVVVPLDKESDLVENLAKEWELCFTTEMQAFFKNEKTRQMDMELGDIYGVICDREIEISHQLAQQILEDKAFLTATSDLCGELDCLLALAHGAIEYGLTRPILTEENIIDIKSGRHILHELTVPSFIPNSTLLGSSASCINNTPSVQLLTGPNFSGKSVYLKQVAIIVHLAHIGSFVPAEKAIVGITDKILTRVTTRETVSKLQSAFVIDMQQMSRAINSCTNRSLLVIDEFGKGTNSCDGAGLAAAVYEHFLSLGSECPKVLASTHFHEIFEQQRFDGHQNVTCSHMEVLINRKRVRTIEDLSSEVAYFYNLRPGRSTLSYGTQCAAMNGIQTCIVERAAYLADIRMQGEDLVAACAMLPVSELEDLKDAEFLARRLLQLDLNGGAVALNAKGLISTIFSAE